MSSFLHTDALNHIEKHLDRFPLIKLDSILDWAPIEQYLASRKTAICATMADDPPILCSVCSKPYCSANGTASLILNSNTASSLASTSNYSAASTTSAFPTTAPFAVSATGWRKTTPSPN